MSGSTSLPPRAESRGCPPSRPDRRQRRSERIRRTRRRLRSWYARHARDLPWRRTRDPWAVWVSEVMLQQTQVATVVPYFERFMKRFADVPALARAPLDDVLKCWEGLGYYGRARNLHKAAKVVVDAFGGELPRAADELRRLPGVGRYTAGAIASIAFGCDEPVLDGNVTRVLCRVFRVRTAPKETATQKTLWSLARDLMPRGRAGEFNQALMDLGATVCTSRRPACPRCPLRGVCLARARGEETSLPVRTPRRPVPHWDVAVAVIRKRGRILIARRKPEGLLGGLWEFPGGKRRRNESLETCVVREVREELGLEVRIRRALVTARHAYTHFRVTLHAFECDHVSGRPRPTAADAWTWVRPDDLDDYAFPGGSRKIIDALRSASTPPAASRRRK